MTTNSELSQFIASESSSVQRTFPFVHEDEAADMVEFFVNDDPYYGDRIDGRLTIYRSQKTGDLVGVMLKGVSKWITRILADFPYVRLSVTDGLVELGCLFTVAQAQAMGERDSKLEMAYRCLAERAAKLTIRIRSSPAGENFSENRTVGVN